MRILPNFAPLLADAIKAGFIGVAIVQHNGKVIGLAGTFREQTAEQLATQLTSWLDNEDVAPRLFGDEVITISVDDANVSVAHAKDQIYVIAMVAAGTPEELRLFAALCDIVADALERPGRGRLLPPSAGGSGGAGPAHLALVEYGLTIRRDR
jgi:hypothetical protein